MKKTTAHCRGMGILILLLLTSLLSFSQNNFKVTGKLKDEAGKPLEGATVEEKGTKNATTTDQGGNFQLNVSSAKAKLTVSFVGYESLEVTIGTQREFSLAMNLSSGNLTDVVVIGYATVKKKDVTGAVASINQKDIKSRPVANALQAMQGKIAGV